MKDAWMVVVVAALAVFLPERLVTGEEIRQILPGNVVAYVNGQPISTQVLERAVEQHVQADDQSPGSERESALRALINSELLYQESQARKIRVKDNEIALELEVLRMSPDQFSGMVTIPGEAPEILAERIARKLAIEKTLERMVGADAAVGKQAISAFYESHREEFLRREQIRLGHIFVHAGAPPLTVRDQRQRIESLKRRIDAGEKFSEVARCCSDDRDAAQKGGDRGYFSRDDLPFEIGEIAFRLDVGEVSQIIEDSNGYHLILAIDHLPQQYTSLEEVTGPIRAYLENQVKQQRLRILLDELASKAEIVIMERVKVKEHVNS